MSLADLDRKYGLAPDPQQPRGLAALDRKYRIGGMISESPASAGLPHDQIEAATGMELDEPRGPLDALKRVASGTLSSLDTYADYEEAALRTLLPSSLEDRATDLLLGNKRRAMEQLAGAAPGQDIDEAARARFINAGSGTSPVEEAIADTAGHGLGLMADLTGLLPVGRLGRAAKPAVEAAQAAPSAVARAAESMMPAAREVTQRLDVIRPPEAPFQYNLGRLDIDEGAQQEFRSILAENIDAIQAQRRAGEGSWDKFGSPEGLAHKLGLTPEKLMSTKAGTAFNDEELAVLDSTLGGVGRKMQDMARVIAAGDDSTVNKATLGKLREQYAALLRVSAGAGSEAGRALNSLKALKPAMDADTATRLEILKKHAGKITDEQIQALAEVDPNNPDELYGLLRQLDKPKFGDYVYEYFVSNLLSGPGTHVVNTMGNVINTGLNEALRPAVAFLDPRRSVDEVLPAWTGAIRGVPEGLTRGLKIILRGTNFDETGKLIAQRSAWERSPSSLVRAVAPAINWPLRALSASDALFKSIAYSAELNAAAVRTAKEAGLGGDALAQEVARLARDPTPKMIQEAGDYAKFSTFQDEPSEFTQHFGRAISKVPAGRFIVPFMKIADRLLARGFEYTPVGLAKIATKEGKARAADLTMRAGVGSAVMTTMAAMALDGRLTGAAPRDAREREMFYAEGKQPYSVLVRGQWMPFSALEPISTPAMVVAGLHDGWKNSGEVPTEQKILAAMTSMMGAQIDRAYFRGLLDLMSDFESPGSAPDKLKNTGVRQALAMVPGSSLLRSTAVALDPTLRKAETLGERFMAQTPGLSDDLPPRTDSFGEPIQRVSAKPVDDPASFLRAMVSSRGGTPLSSSPAKSDPVVLALQEAGLNPSTVIRSLDGEKLDPSLSDEASRESGKLARERLERLVNSPDFWLLSRERKKARLGAAMDIARDRARNNLRRRVRSMGN